MRIAVDALPALPGKSGAVGAFRAMLQLAPELDESLELIYLVSPSQQAYYQKFLDTRYADRIKFVVFGYSERHRALRLLAQHVHAPLVCQREAAAVHFSLNPEPLFGMPGIHEVFKVADLQFFDVPEEFGMSKVAYRKFMGRRKAQRADVIIANSRYTQQRIMECFGITGERIRVIYEAVDHSLFHSNDYGSQSREVPAQKFDVTKPYVIYVSSFRPYKNHLLLLRAYDTLVRDYDVPHHLVLVGNDVGNYRRVVEKATSELGLTGRVRFLDYVHHWDLPDLYRAASLAVYPSEYETFGIPPLEAMACGTPVIASSLTAVPEISGGGACIVNPHDIEQMACVMSRVLADGAYCQALAHRGLAWCRQYTWKRNISETLELFRAFGS